MQAPDQTPRARVTSVQVAIVVIVILLLGLWQIFDARGGRLH